MVLTQQIFSLDSLANKDGLPSLHRTMDLFSIRRIENNKVFILSILLILSKKMQL